ncbi:MAG TPA: hypothetical protein VNT32_13155 [Thermoleophilaceae bacterium]|nr:hypothetical protein [Thermoleophilaceae bacterium]
MGHRVGIIFSGARADHHIFSPSMDFEEASGEFRAIRRLIDEGGEVIRNWAHIPAGAVIAIHVMEDGDQPA